MTREEAQKKIQELLLRCKDAISEIDGLVAEHGIEGFRLEPLNMTYHLTRHTRWDDRIRRLAWPGFYDDEFWTSSTAGCDLELVYEPNEEEP